MSTLPTKQKRASVWARISRLVGPPSSNRHAPETCSREMALRRPPAGPRKRPAASRQDRRRRETSGADGRLLRPRVGSRAVAIFAQVSRQSSRNLGSYLDSRPQACNAFRTHRHRLDDKTTTLQGLLERESKALTDIDNPMLEGLKESADAPHLQMRHSGDRAAGLQTRRPSCRRSELAGTEGVSSVAFWPGARGASSPLPRDLRFRNGGGGTPRLLPHVVRRAHMLDKSRRQGPTSPLAHVEA